ncbi:hypothetical protein [Jiella sonneratiae]|uniref:Capsule biosynthesis protein n=1 Tax=Jiella sonneratiae TaxID=2816856 RepID=A0ABS3J4F6_9HYPH|nr:hypothetical protein [Jiella sonneratiae]MBO0904565.1 hypothetical protein [Jiella sonneratiae]
MSALTTFDDLRARLPGRAKSQRKSLRKAFSAGRTLFYVMVVLPFCVSVVYYGFVATGRYVSESRYLVRSASSQDVSGFSSILKTFGISRSDDDSYAVQSYMQSRDVLHELMKTLPMEEMLDPKGIDLISRCYWPWEDHDFESLYQCYLSRVSAIREETTGISMVTVSLYTPEDSKKVAETLIGLGEALANRMNRRAENDALSNATEFMAQAEARVMEADKNLTEFRNEQKMLDIKAGAAPTANVIAGLTTELAHTRAEIEQQERVSPSNPGLPSLRTKAMVIEDQITKENAKLTGSGDSLSNQISNFENLSLRKQIADQALSIASRAIDQARLEAKRQRIYIETIVQPNLPDEETEPNRLRIIVSVLVVSLMLFVVAWMLMIGGREHLNKNNT